MRIRTRMFFLLLLPLVFSLLGRPASASTSMVLQAVGSVQGPILGGSTVAGHTDWIDILSYSWGIEVPIAANGQPTGPAKPTALTLMKSFDRASLKLLAAVQTGEVLPTWTMDFVDNGTSTVYYRIALTVARIVSIQQSGSSEPPFESVSLSYSTITLTDVAQGISVTYSWDGGGTAAIATQEMLAKGILLPPSPNPTRGQTQFRFSLPSGMDSDLTLFDAQGRLVRKLHHGSTSAQSVVTVWDGTDDGGMKVAPGVYMARLAYPGAVVTQHFAVVR
jgi:type VI secretion system Hcp family effector